MSDWPCTLAALESAREFVRGAASKGGKVLLAPDRDADGLCAGKTLRFNSVHPDPDLNPAQSSWVVHTLHAVKCKSIPDQTSCVCTLASPSS